MLNGLLAMQMVMILGVVVMWCFACGMLKEGHLKGTVLNLDASGHNA